MSLLLRAAVLGGIAYFVTKSMRNNALQRRSMQATDSASGLRDELHPEESDVWPTSESKQPLTANNPGPGV